MWDLSKLFNTLITLSQRGKRFLLAPCLLLKCHVSDPRVLNCNSDILIFITSECYIWRRDACIVNYGAETL